MTMVLCHVKVSDYNLNYLRTPTFSHVIHDVRGGGGEKNTKQPVFTDIANNLCDNPLTLNRHISSCRLFPLIFLQYSSMLVDTIIFAYTQIPNIP